MGDLLREMRWLGARRAGAYLRLFALLNLAMVVLLVATSHRGVDRNGFLLGSDFISFWTTGRMLLAGGHVYDGAAHIAAQRAHFASADGYTAFFYPPGFLPFCAPLGLLGYFPALALWLAATGALYIAAVERWFRIPQPLWLVTLAFPAIPIVITHGQTAFLVAGLLGLGARLVPDRPVLAGVLFGLATIKPQFGLLLPLALLLTREWKVIVAAAFTALALGLAGSLGGGWSEWLGATARAQQAMEQGAVPFGKMVSLFAGLRLVGIPVGAAYALQAVAALIVAGAVVKQARRASWSPGLAALVLAGALLVTPFALDYDLVLLAFPLLWLVGQALETGFAPYEKLAIALAFVAPAFARPVALAIAVPIAPLVLAVLFVVILRRNAVLMAP